MSLQLEFLNSAQRMLESDARVRAAWVSGSLGRGIGDRWSDVDLHVLLAESDQTFRAGMQRWLENIRPLVLFRWLFDGAIANALTVDGLRMDILLHNDTPVLNAEGVRILFDRGAALTCTAAIEQAVDPVATADYLRDQIEEFWRCVVMLPTVIGRNELIVSFTGLNIELGLVTAIVLRGYGTGRESGVKRLNQFLPPGVQTQLESALALQGLTRSSLSAAHIALASIVQEHGRVLAGRWSFEYPETLETAVLNYVRAELALLDVAAPD